MGISRKPKQEGKSRLLTERDQLQQAQAELARKQAELERQLRQIPVKMEEVRKREREVQRINVTTVARGEINGRLREIRSSGAEPRQRRALKGERRKAQMKFLLLCLILVTILMLLWRAVPN